MKFLNLKNTNILMMAFLTMSIMFTSCKKENLNTPTEVEAIELSDNKIRDLTQSLQNDSDFKSLIKISKLVSNKLTSLKEESNFSTFIDLANSDSFVNPYYEHIESIKKHEKNIRLKYPEINTLNKIEIENIYKSAVENTSHKSGECEEECDSFYQSLNQEDTAAAQSQIAFNCVNPDGTHDDACCEAVIAWLIQAFQSNDQWHNDCIADCPDDPCLLCPIDDELVVTGPIKGGFIIFP